MSEGSVVTACPSSAVLHTKLSSATVWSEHTNRALNVTAIVTDVQVEIIAVLGVEEPDPRLITTGQTSECVFTLDKLWSLQR